MSSSTPTTTSTASDFNVSLEPHLVETLTPLVPVLPENLSARLRTALASAPIPSSSPSPTAEADHDLAAPAVDAAHTAPVISYAFLSTLSAWARTAAGSAALAAHSPSLKAGDYLMVSLLAGTRTSPEKIFPDAPAVLSEEQTARKELNDRRAVTALLNALLSIAGSGVAVWWAADKLRWRNEWKVLLALAAALTVAVAEGVLYLIWQSRRSASRVQGHAGRTRKRDPRRIAPEADAVELSPSGLVDEPGSATEGQPRLLAGDSPSAPSANIQEYATVGGLRERGPGINKRKGR